MRLVETYLDYFKLCRRLANDGFKFELIQTPQLIKNRTGKGRVNAYMIRWRSPSTSLWSPISVIHHELYAISSDPWKPHTMAYREIGLSKKAYLKIFHAELDTEKAVPSLRKDMLRALKVKDVPHSRRIVFRRRRGNWICLQKSQKNSRTE